MNLASGQEKTKAHAKTQSRKDTQRVFFAMPLRLGVRFLLLTLWCSTLLFFF
jgi:hypothetical protein